MKRTKYKSTDRILLYAVYFHQAREQKTNSIDKPLSFAARFLGWKRGRVRAAALDLLIHTDLLQSEEGKFTLPGRPGPAQGCYHNMKPKKSGKKDRNSFHKKHSPKLVRRLIQFSKWFHKEQRKNWPNFIKKKATTKKILKGAQVLSQLITLDGFNFYSDIKPTLQWAVHDEFWSRNVLSLSGLRHKSKTNEETKFVNIMKSHVGKSWKPSKKKDSINIGLQASEI